MTRLPTNKKQKPLMQANPCICGLMLSYFKADMTLKCLQTLENQGLEHIVLVDNSANEEENRRTKALKAHFPDGWLKIVTAPENLGFAKGMNTALKQAHQLGNWDYLLILNNDITAKPELVKQLHLYMAENPETALVGAEAAITIHDKKPTSSLYYQRLTGMMFQKPVVGSFQVASGYCLMIRPEVIHNSLFDPRYFMYGEDVELTWRLLRQKQKIHVLTAPLIIHEPAQSSGNGELFYEYHVNRGHWLLVESLGRNYFERLLMYTLRVPLLIARAALRSWRLRSISPLHALTMCGLNLPIKPAP